MIFFLHFRWIYYSCIWIHLFMYVIFLIIRQTLPCFDVQQMHNKHLWNWIPSHSSLQSIHLHLVSISVPTFLNPVPCHHLYLAYYHNLWTRLSFSIISPLHSVFPIILPYASTDHVNSAKTYKESSSGSLGPPNPSRTFFF